MPGMNSGLSADDPTLVAAFRSALLHQGLFILAVFGLLLLAHWTLRGRAAEARRPAHAEPRARRLLRIGFGVLWIADGILQAQPKMVVALPSQVIEPSAAASPHWVRDVVNAGGTIWSFHPVQAAAAAVWIQVGIGLWLIAAETGWWSRLAGLASVSWGLVVWVFGEAFGAIFAPGLSWLTGAPGAVLLYVTAGALIALPARAWASPRPGRWVLACAGVFWSGMAVLQAWPGRGFWQGRGGTLTEMARMMSQVTQPHAQAAMVSAFASFAGAHGAAVNAGAVTALGALGLALASGRPRLLRVAVPAAAAFCLADWVLVQDFGVPGGLGTDPNSMLPWVLLLCAGYLALAAVPAPASQAVVPAGPSVRAAGWGRRAPGAMRDALRPAAVVQAIASASTRSVTALGAAGVVLAGAAPIAAVSAERNADPIIARAIAGAPEPVDLPAPGFRLVSQSGKPVTLASLRGKVVLLTFLDPVCAGCLTIAQEFKAAGALLGASAGNVEFVAIAADSTHRDPAFIRAFDRKGGFGAMPNWLFLTGSLGQLQQVWTRYERIAPRMMTGMTVYSNVTFVIDGAGRIRQKVKDSPGPGTTSTRSSFAVVLSGAARQALPPP
jgi:cytochrome oxidase Cu insertion factor (SCO1/SenC/PrrC family)